MDMMEIWMEKDFKCDYLSCVTVHETHFSDQLKNLSTIGGGRVAFCFLCNLITVWITYILKNSKENMLIWKIYWFNQSFLNLNAKQDIIKP